MVPHGDRIHAAESGGVEHQDHRPRRGHDHIVRVFVLHDDLGDVPVTDQPVIEHVLERGEVRRVRHERGTLGSDLADDP